MTTIGIVIRKPDGLYQGKLATLTLNASILITPIARIITETVSGSTAIAQRRGFSKLLDRLEAGDVVIATKLDRLGRDAIDVSAAVKAFSEMGVKVYCLALGGADLTSSFGTMTMQVLNAVE